jgi:cytochrome c6
MILRKIKSGVLRGLFVIPLLAFGAIDSHAADIANGGKLYAMHCVICHGANGVNVMPDAPNFARSESLLRPDVFILAAIKEGKNAMPAFQGMLKDQEILDVIAYLRTLENGGPISP